MESLRYFRVAQPANVLVVVGTLGTLIFGIWLAIERDDVPGLGRLDPRRARALGGRLGDRQRGGGAPYIEAQEARRAAGGRGPSRRAEPRAARKLKDRNAMMLQALSSLAVLLLLLDMIYKPGA